MALANLGDKKLSLFLYSGSKELYEQFLDYFPKLSKGGGYELLRAGDRGGKNLVEIDMPASGYSVEYLKAVVSSAKVYIRPLQEDLDLQEHTSKVSKCSFVVCYWHLQNRSFVKVSCKNVIVVVRCWI